MPVLRSFFNYCSDLSVKPYDGKKYVHPKDFLGFWMHTELYPQYLNEQEIYLIFLLSMMTQVDEVNSARHFRMTFIEFVEGFTRVAEKVSPSSPNHQQKRLSEVKRKALPLFVKFEGLCFICYNRLSGKLNDDDKSREIVRQSILQTQVARKKEIYEEMSSDDDDKMSLKSNISFEKMIQKELLFFDQRPSGKQNRLKRQMTLESVPERSNVVVTLKEKASKNGEDMSKWLSQMKQVEADKKKVEWIEDEELEELSAERKRKLRGAQNRNKRLSLKLLERKATYNFEDQI